MVVLHPLPRGKVVMNQARTDAAHLVGAQRRPHTAPANCDSPLDDSTSHCASHRKDKIRKVIRRVQFMSPEVEHLMPIVPQALEDFLLQFVATVVRCNSEFHAAND